MSAETRTLDDRLATHAHSPPAAALQAETRDADRADQGPLQACGNMAFLPIAPHQPQGQHGDGRMGIWGKLHWVAISLHATRSLACILQILKRTATVRHCRL